MREQAFPSRDRQEGTTVKTGNAERLRSRYVANLPIRAVYLAAIWRDRLPPSEWIHPLGTEPYAAISQTHVDAARVTRRRQSIIALSLRRLDLKITISRTIRGVGGTEIACSEESVISAEPCVPGSVSTNSRAIRFELKVHDGVRRSIGNAGRVSGQIGLIFEDETIVAVTAADLAFTVCIKRGIGRTDERFGTANIAVPDLVTPMRHVCWHPYAVYLGPLTGVNGGRARRPVLTCLAGGH
jgi:hypothetical protein